MKGTALYCRVSTGDQSLASQLPDLERCAAAQAGPVLWFTDHYTGRTMQRPGLDELLAAVRAGELARVVVWRLDRLGRTARGLLELVEELQARGVGLVSLREGLDLSTPAGRLMVAVLAGMAQYETEVRGERVRAGIAAARAAGRRIGGSQAGRRSRKVATKATVVRQLGAAGLSISAIARTVGLTRPTVRSLLSSESQP